MVLRLKHLPFAAILLLLWFVVNALAQGTQAAAQSEPKVFVFVQRSESHVKHSKSEVFRAVVDNLASYLRDKNVAIATDQFGGRSYSEEKMALSSVQGIARDTGATSLLYVFVERPFVKWLKVTLTCYDSAGHESWEEEISSGGGMTGAHGLRVTLDRMHEKIDQRVGQACLPLQAVNAKNDQATSNVK